MAEGLGHGVELCGDGHDVNVVRHQAPAEDGEAVLIALAAQEVEVEMPIGVGSEYGLAVVAALGDVMRYVDRHDPRSAGHLLIDPAVRIACFAGSVNRWMEYG